MDVMYNITLERQKFYERHGFNNSKSAEDVEVIYTWEMDFNRSVLGASTLLVPKKPTSVPSTNSMQSWAYNSWICLFAAMLVVAIGGNAMVIWIVTAHRRMRTVTNYFLVNLSCADLMMASLNCLFNFIYMLHSDWKFGVRYCQLSNFIANVTVAASVFTLTGISFDRYQAIVTPMHPRMSKTYSLVMILIIWLSGMILAIPCLLYSTTIEHRYEFVPIAFETVGPWGSEARLFIRDIGRRMREKDLDPRSGSFMAQRISLAIQRGNAARVMGTFGQEALAGGFIDERLLLATFIPDTIPPTVLRIFSRRAERFMASNLRHFCTISARTSQFELETSEETLSGVHFTKIPEEGSGPPYLIVCFFFRYRGTIKTACLLVWPDGLPDVSDLDYMYQVLFFVTTYAIPMLGMTFFYSAIGRVLWGSGSIGELTQRQIDSIRSKRKVVKMFILVISIFGLCWLPYQLYFIITHLDRSLIYKKYIKHVYLGFYWLAMANSMVNPIIYFWMNAKFRAYFKTALCGWQNLFKRQKRPLPESPPEASHSGSRSRSGFEDPSKSDGAAREWLHLPCPPPLARRQSLKPLSLASCPRCLFQYDAVIHGQKV